LKLAILPLTPERWPDLEAVFGARGCSIARSCWCMAYRLSGDRKPLAEGQRRSAVHRAALKALVDGGRPPGLLAYHDGVPVGWVSLGPREDFAKLQRSPVMKPVDDRPVWSIVCFVVPPQHRGQGVAHALLRGAIAYAREQGATLLEAYPRGPSRAVGGRHPVVRAEVHLRPRGLPGRGTSEAGPPRGPAWAAVNPKDLVRTGYDRVSLVYRPDEDARASQLYAPWLARLCAALPPAPRILDLGCGCGLPATRELAKRGRSPAWTSPRCRWTRPSPRPGARFLCADMCAVELPPGTFDAVVSFYAVVHVPLEEQEALFRRIAGWLKPGGLFLATLGRTAWTGTESDWLDVEGASMYWSHADAATYRRWLEDAGFVVLLEIFVPEAGGGHQLFLGRLGGTGSREVPA
jgi:SAM-dependent methyltransferase/GNAT superfamily N-acetyltransferase